VPLPIPAYGLISVVHHPALTCRRVDTILKRQQKSRLRCLRSAGFCAERAWRTPTRTLCGGTSAGLLLWAFELAFAAAPLDIG
jgi:hypothetical protein